MEICFPVCSLNCGQKAVVNELCQCSHIYRYVFVCIYAHTYIYSGGIVCARRFLYTLYKYILRITSPFIIIISFISNEIHGTRDQIDAYTLVGS